jgi:transposase-like protein
MPTKKRRSFTAEQKAAILRRHHTGKVPVSQLCEEEDLQPSVFYYVADQRDRDMIPTSPVLTRRARPVRPATRGRPWV